eukprot:TRINITY_DN2574_c0_g1_i3.p3 TRINITY_DN2574_c0_g1~~TRINITY_DN2574_c0_g1_i3.p3  ORF type:complete len:103 (-),score=10.85 TRINITY_DN2574_c0_g1_i3:126-434(-)
MSRTSVLCPNSVHGCGVNTKNLQAVQSLSCVKEKKKRGKQKPFQYRITRLRQATMTSQLLQSLTRSVPATAPRMTDVALQLHMNAWPIACKAYACTPEAFNA